VARIRFRRRVTVGHWIISIIDNAINLGIQWKESQKRAALHKEYEQEFEQLATAAERVAVECRQRAEASFSLSASASDARAEDFAGWAAATADWAERATDLRRWATYHAVLSRKCERATFLRWVIVPPDPPPPEFCPVRQVAERDRAVVLVEPN
jgi:hypothetical protein